MSDPELMGGLNYELLFLESLKLVVRPDHPLLQDTVTLSRVMEWPVVVCPKGPFPPDRRNLAANAGVYAALRVYRNAVGLAFAPADLDYDYVWFVPPAR
jgi:DNA-binding transcriptional LysR family regulator